MMAIELTKMPRSDDMVSTVEDSYNPIGDQDLICLVVEEQALDIVDASYRRKRLI